MHKFFCRYNQVTESYELSNTQGQNLFNRIRVQAEDDLLPKIKNCLISLSKLFAKIHIVLDIAQQILSDAEPILTSIMTENETQTLAISNMHYQIFNSALPAESLPIEDKEWTVAEALSTLNDLLLQASNEALELEKNINIAELNRACLLLEHSISNQLQKMSYLKSKYCND